MVFASQTLLDFFTCLKHSKLACSVALDVRVPVHPVNLVHPVYPQLDGRGAICSMSPMSLQLSLQLYEAAAQQPMSQVMRRDFKIAANYTRHGWDFWRGVRSKLVERQKAQWMHGTVEDVPDALIQRLCREPDFCEGLDLNVVDRFFEGTKGDGSGAGRSLVELADTPEVMLRARL
jgi:hypothetical protein